MEVCELAREGRAGAAVETRQVGEEARQTPRHLHRDRDTLDTYMCSVSLVHLE